MGLWTPMIIGRSKFLGVESGGGPENHDEEMVRGVHWIEISILSLKMLDMECLPARGLWKQRYKLIFLVI